MRHQEFVLSLDYGLFQIDRLLVKRTKRYKMRTEIWKRYNQIVCTMYEQSIVLVGVPNDTLDTPEKGDQL